MPNTFVAGTVAKAADVNANFAALATAVNGNAQDIANLQTAVKSTPAAVVQDSAGKILGRYIYDESALQTGLVLSEGGIPPNCTQTNTGGLNGPPTPVFNVVSVDLSGFVPPFSVQ